MSRTDERSQPERARQGRRRSYRVRRRSRRGWAHWIVTSARVPGKKNAQGEWVQSLDWFCRVEDWVTAREQEAVGERDEAAHLERQLEAIARLWGTTPDALEGEEVAGGDASLFRLTRETIAGLHRRADQIDADIAAARSLGPVRPCPCGGVAPRPQPYRRRDESWLRNALRDAARRRLAEQQARALLGTEPGLRADPEAALLRGDQDGTHAGHPPE